MLFKINKIYSLPDLNLLKFFSEYTIMVDNLQVAFDRLTEKYIHRLSSSDEEIAVEYQLPTPSRKHKLKSSESPTRQQRKKRKSQSDPGMFSVFFYSEF